MSFASAARRPTRRPLRAVTERLEQRSLLSGSLTGVVFDDLNADGYRQPTDPPLANQTVELSRYLHDTNTTERLTTLTADDGTYTFGAVTDGTWSVRWVPADGRFRTGFSPSDPRFVSFPFDPARYPQRFFEFGTALHGSIAGTVFHDADRDGTRDPGEAPLTGQVVYLDADYDHRPGPYERQALTDENGAYRFDNLRPSRQSVRHHAAPGWLRTAPSAGLHDVRITSGAAVTDADFGAARVPAVAGLTLIDPATDQPVGPLVHGATINVADFGGRINVRADLADGLTDRDVESVRFNLNGNPNFRVESAAPYALGGDTAGDYHPWRPRVGSHTLIVTAYTGDNGTGERGPAHVVTFNVVDGTARARPLRINAGGRFYTTTTGDTFLPDHGFRGGLPRPLSLPILGTEDDALYAAHRFGRRMLLARTVPSGNYTLRLHFAESVLPAGRRVFDVYAEGRRVLDDYDVAADAGRRTAAVHQFPVTVTDRRLDVSFIASRGDAIVSAVELIPAPASPIHPAPLYLDAGGATPFTDSVARVFDPDEGRSDPAGGFAGGRAVAENFDVEGTTDDALYATHRAGSAFSLRRPVANGNYALLLGFAEPLAGAAEGSRTFDVFAERRQVLNDYDITAAAGAPRAAVAEALGVSVTDGALDVAFRGVVGEAIVSSIVLIPTDVPDAAKPYSREAWSESTRRIVSASNLRQIGQGVMMYANEHKGKYPPDIGSIVPYFDSLLPFANPRTNTKVPRGELADTVEPAAWIRAHDGYLYVGAGLTYRNGAEAPLAYENPRKTAGPILVLFADGHVDLLPRDQAAALLGFDPAPPADPAPPPPDATEPPYRANPEVLASRANLLAIAQGVQMHANENKGNLPYDLARLFETQDVTVAHFLNPRDNTAPPPAGLTRAELAQWVQRHGDYAYAGAGRNYTTPHHIAIAWEHPAEMQGGINLLFPGGRVEFREMRWAVETIRRSLAWTRGR